MAAALGRFKIALMVFSSCVILLLILQAVLPSSSFRGGRQLLQDDSQALDRLSKEELIAQLHRLQQQQGAAVSRQGSSGSQQGAVQQPSTSAAGQIDQSKQATAEALGGQQGATAGEVIAAAAVGTAAVPASINTAASAEQNSVPIQEPSIVADASAGASSGLGSAAAAEETAAVIIPSGSPQQTSSEQPPGHGELQRLLQRRRQQREQVLALIQSQDEAGSLLQDSMHLQPAAVEQTLPAVVDTMQQAADQASVQPVSTYSSPEVNAAAAAAATVAAAQQQTEQAHSVSVGHRERSHPHWWEFLKMGDAVKTDQLQQQEPPPQASSAHVSVRVKASAKEDRSDRKPFYSLFVLTTSGMPWRDRRDRLRKQWKRNIALIDRPAEFPVIMRFAVGTLDTSDENRAAMYREDAEHHDVTFLQCLDLDDELNTHSNWHVEAGPSATTQKVLLGMQWAVRRFDFDYFMKLGDDSYFRVDKMVGMIANQIFPNKKVVVGQILEAEVHGVKLKYAQGMGYLVSHDICEFAAHATQHLLDTAPEDCVVAKWMMAMGVKFQHHNGFRDTDFQASCDSELIVMHKLKPELWPRIKDNGECTA